MRNTLEASIAEALTDYAGDYDLDAVAEDLRARGYENAGDVDPDEFWAVVDTHALQNEELDPAEAFRTEMTEALATQRSVGDPATWTRGGVTVQVAGASRVTHNWPQPGAVVEISVAGAEELITVRGERIGSWAEFWSLVDGYLQDWAAAVEERRAAYAEASDEVSRLAAALEAARGRAARAQEALTEVVGDEPGASAEMTAAQVAEYLGIAEGSVRRQMSRWEIEARYERLPGAVRPRALYPAGKVRAAAQQRPGRGSRTDLRSNP